MCIFKMSMARIDETTSTTRGSTYKVLNQSLDMLVPDVQVPLVYSIRPQGQATLKHTAQQESSAPQISYTVDSPTPAPDAWFYTNPHCRHDGSDTPSTPAVCFCSETAVRHEGDSWNGTPHSQLLP